MGKKSVKTMKADEMNVLNVLRAHAKENVKVLGKRCGFSSQKAARIIKNLENEKKICGYTAVEDGETNELKHFVLLVKRSMVPLDEDRKREVTMEKLDDYVPGVLKIDDIFITHGMFDGVVTFYAKDILSAKKLVSEMSSRIGKHFKEYILLESLFSIQKQGFKNPQIKNLVEYI
jgi:DNA-binding Lrp family transcriptional regulator